MDTDVLETLRRIGQTLFVVLLATLFSAGFGAGWFAHSNETTSAQVPLHVYVGDAGDVPGLRDLP